ncbi:PD-(D/E)XK nuclease family protein [Alteribacter aurantiacus]|uniref:PD-(D/E)XK nuclease family protein n=1 Tax=Alteribacter aurantiacus TaxID=254410 RepID=UPI00040F2339|nr:PD-(D/E)XK nuclease family protein [Alteribacter aurantiacus]
MSPEFFEQLKAIMKSHPIEEKVLVVPSKRDGRLAIDALAKNGTPVVNVHTKTIEDLVKESVLWKVERDNKHEIPEEVGRQMVFQIMKSLKDGGAFKYFSKIKLTPSLSEAVFKGILDIKRNVLNVKDLSPTCFQHKDKGQDFLQILSRYEMEKEEKGYVDRADLIQKALYSEEKADSNIIFIYFPHDAYQALTASFLTRYVKEAKLYRPQFSNVANSEQNRQMLSVERDIQSQTIEEKITTNKPMTTLGVAFSAEDEINQVLAHLKRNSIPLDQAAIYYPASNPYHHLLFQLKEKEGIGITFAEGVPISYYPSGKALFALLNWIRSDFTLLELERLLEERLIYEAEGMSAKQMVTALKQYGVHKGLHSYKRVTERMVEKGKRDSLTDWLTSLLSLIPIQGRYESVDYSEFLQSLTMFLKSWVRHSGQEDASCRSHIELMVDQIAPHMRMHVKGSEAVTQAEYWLSKMNATASMPKPGHLHVTPVRTSLYYHFDHVFVVGMTSKNVPGTQKEDPILLDQERMAIHPHMMTSVEHMKRQSWKTVTLTTSLSGETFFSYPLMDIAGNRKSSPAYAFIQLYRVLYNKRDATGEQVESDLGKEVAIVSLASTEISEMSWWSDKLFGGMALDSRFYKSDLFAHLLQGEVADNKRRTNDFTAYDGHLRGLTSHLSPLKNENMVMSASKLETLAQCPYKYFLKHVLEIEVEDEVEEDRYVWLDPATKGTLLHTIFERFYQNLYDRGKTFEVDGTFEWIEPIAREAIEEVRVVLPPPNEVIYELETKDILDACFIFLRLEETFSQNRKPVYFEYEFGFKDQYTVKIPIEDKGQLEVRGKIDRVDQLPDGTYSTVDYKSGSTFGFDEDRYYNGGRKVQHSLYAYAFELLNHGKLVSSSHYLFPTKKGQGEQVVRDFGRERKEELVTIVKHLSAFLEEGQFPFTDDPDDCKFCDFKPVCMRHDYEEELVKEKLTSDRTEGAKLLREVRKHD